MEFRRRHRQIDPPRRVALVPGSYNPPTNAHRALIEAAFEHADEVVAVLPRGFPHKSYEDGAPLEDRLRMLERVSGRPYSIAISEGGLFIEMCAEYMKDAGPAELYVVCGRDAAERILEWKYDDPETLERMFAKFQLLVAARRGEFRAPARFAERIHALGIASEHDEVSSTEVRERLRNGEEWRHLVPGELVSLIEQLYSFAA